MSTKSSVLILTLIALCLGAFVSHATTWTVERDGSGDFTIIQDAVDAAAEGDTIRIGPGEYTESRVWEYDPGIFGETFVGIPINNITLIGTSRDSVIIGPTAQDWDEQNFLPKGITLKGLTADGLRVENLTVRNCREGLRFGGDAVARNVTLLDNGTGVAAFDGTFSIEDSEIRGSEFNGMLYVATDKTSYMRRVRFINCRRGAIAGNGPTLVIEDSVFENGAVYAEAQFDARVEMYRCVGTGSLNAGVSSQFNSDFILDDCRISVRSQAVVITAGSRAVVRNSVLRTVFDHCVVTTEQSQPTVNNCDLLPGPGMLAVALGLTGADLPDFIWDFTGNWWGTADPDSIAMLIRDSNDFAQIDETVDFSGWRTRSVPTKSKSVGGLKGRYRAVKGSGN